MQRIINFANGAEVRCPYWMTDVDIMGKTGCMPGLEERCEHLSNIDVGTVVCTWTEADGQREEVSEYARVDALH